MAKGTARAGKGRTRVRDRPAVARARERAPARTRDRPVAPPPEPDGQGPAEAEGPADGSRPSGQRLYDLPYSADNPRLVNPDLGLRTLVARVGRNAAYSIDVTLLDAPDHRLIRSGVLLAHRVLDGRGEWYLSAPDWLPLLPEDRIEPMGHAELPEAFADLLRPLRRRATIGPVAALGCERREFALRGDDGVTRALLRDDKVTVRRGGLTTARYREVMVTPVGPGLDEEQAGWIERAMLAAGATAVPRFARLATRLGAPATGPTDLPEPRPFEPAAPFRRFVGQLLSLRLRRIVEADLAVKGGDLDAAARLAGEAARLRRELKGLSPVLDADWVEDLYDELDWLVPDPASGSASDGARDQLLPRLRSDRYAVLLERLVVAARSPKVAVADSGQEPPVTKGRPAAEVMAGLVRASTARLTRSVDRLDPDAAAARWDEAWRAAVQAVELAALAVEVPVEQSSAVRERLDAVAGLFAGVHDRQVALQGAEERAHHLTPAEAFAAGREHQRRLDELVRLRREVLQAWAKARRKVAT